MRDEIDIVKGSLEAAFISFARETDELNNTMKELNYILKHGRRDAIHYFIKQNRERFRKRLP